MLYNIVDRMYIGRLEGIGTDALAGVGACLPVILLVSAFAALASMGGAPAPRSSWAGATAKTPNAPWATA